MGYLANFMVYTFAMVGVIVIALLVFKNSTSVGIAKKSKCLKVLDSMSLSPRKHLYIVSAGEEKFLIAGDVDKTTLISKLDTKLVLQEKNISSQINSDKNADALFEYSNEQSFKETMNSMSKPRASYMDNRNINGITSSMINTNMNQVSVKGAVIKNLAEKIRG